MAFDQQVKRTINGQDVVPNITSAPQANTTGNITATAQTIVATDLVGIGSATVQFKGTYAGVNVTFEASPDAGTTWVAVNGFNTATNAVTSSGATGAIATNATIAYNVGPLLGFDQFRVRSTAFTSGSAAVVIHVSAQWIPPVIGTQPVSGTLAVSTIAGAITPGTAATNLGKAEDAVHTSGDVGIMSLAVRNDALATTFTSANGDYSPIAVSNTGEQYVVQRAPAASVSRVTSVATNVTLLAANGLRKGGAVYNESTSNLFVKMGTAASTTSYTIRILPDGYWEIPAFYSGQIDGIWATANGAAQVTEVS